MQFSDYKKIIPLLDKYSREIASADNIGSINRILSRAIDDIFHDLKNYYFLIYNATSDKFELMCSHHVTEQEIKHLRSIKNTGFFHQKFKDEETVCENDLHNKISQVPFCHNSGSLLMFPAYNSKSRYGIFLFYSDEKDYFQEEEINLLKFFGNTATHSCFWLKESKKHFEKLDDYVTSEAFNKSVVEYGSDIIIVVNHQGEILYHNPSSERTLGYQHGTLVGKSVFEYIHSSNYNFFKKSFERSIREESVQKIEFQFLCADGQYRYFETNTINLLPTEGLEGVILDIRDIIERKKAEENLAKQQAMLNEILGALPIDIFLKDESGNYLFLNDQAAQTLGYRKESVIGKSDSDIYPPEIAEEIRKNDFQVRKSKNLVIREESIKVNNGFKYLLSGKKVIRSSVENDSLLLGYSIDITENVKTNQELKQQKHFIQQVIDTDPNLIFVKDWNGKFILVNQAVADLFEVSKEDLINKNDVSIHHNTEELDLLSQTDREVIATGKENIVEESYSLPSGEVKWFQTTRKPLNREDGSVHVLAISVDITQRKKDAEELIRAKKAKEQFLANMSHEIRTPINGIAGMLNLLLETITSEEQEKYLQAIKSSTENLKVIINDILDISKIESGKLRFEKIGFKLEYQILAVIDSFMLRAREKAVQIQHEIDEKVKAVLLGDPVRLNQILVNLISNAVKFTFTGEVIIRARVLEENSFVQNIEFSVQDTGIGIPSDKLETIFDSFSQADDSVTRKYGGTGLGLAISKQLVELQGGTILVESKENQGTIFRFCLPYEKGKYEDLIVSNQKKDEKTKTIQNQHFFGRQILLVEDNDINQLYAANILKKWGCKVDLAENGLIALEKLKKNDYDVILMDVQMPVMDGYEATKAIRKNFKGSKSDTPIIALTANAIKGDNEKCISVGMNDYISKPFLPDELHHILSRYLNKLIDKVPVASNEIKAQAEITSRFLTDLTYLRAVSDNDKNFMLEMIRSFISNTPALLEILNKNIDEGNLEAAGKIAHKIKPSITFMGMEAVKDEIKKLEIYCKESSHLNEIPGMVKDLNEKCKRAYLELGSTIEKLTLS